MISPLLTRASPEKQAMVVSSKWFCLETPVTPKLRELSCDQTRPWLQGPKSSRGPSPPPLYGLRQSTIEGKKELGSGSQWAGLRLLLRPSPPFWRPCTFPAFPLLQDSGWGPPPDERILGKSSLACEELILKRLR